MSLCGSYIRRISLSSGLFLIIIIALTIVVNYKVEQETFYRIHTDSMSIPYCRIGLLLGTNPLNRYGRPNSYFTTRIKAASDLYHAGKIDYIIASGDNHIREYDEPTAMRDSLIAHGVPAERIIMDYAGFRTLDSVIRAKKVFGCDSITIISQTDHCARAIYIASANGIEAYALSAPIKAGRMTRIRLTLREWLARDKMMLDILSGKQPHFIGEKIDIPHIPIQKSYSTVDGMIMKIVRPLPIKSPVDSLVVDFINSRDIEGNTGEWFRIDKLENGAWHELPLDRRYANDDGEINIMFNCIAYIIQPGSSLQLTVKPWFYVKEWQPGTYRLAKTFRYPPYPIHKSDTAYVVFQVRQ